MLYEMMDGVRLMKRECFAETTSTSGLLRRTRLRILTQSISNVIKTSEHVTRNYHVLHKSKVVVDCFHFTIQKSIHGGGIPQFRCLKNDMAPYSLRSGRPTNADLPICDNI